MNTTLSNHAARPSKRRRLLLAAGALALCLGGGQALGAWAWVEDAKDMADSSGDIRAFSATVLGDHLQLSMTVEGVACPATEQTPDGMNNRYYYHFLLDTDNNPATGRSNSEYEGNPTGVTTPIGADLIVQVGWRNGKPDGIIIYDPANEDVNLVSDFPYQACGNTITEDLPLDALGLVPGQTIAISCFQEGASDGWATDWMESQTLTLDGPAAEILQVDDAKDMADSSGDLKRIEAYVIGDFLYLSMTVDGVACPATEQTPEGMSNRYYYHFLLDTDNNPATGRSNSEYEGNPTGVTNPIGADLIVQVGWRNGKPDGIIIYDPANEDVNLVSEFPYAASGNTITEVLPLEALGLVSGQTIAISAFQEGASDGWATDWMESGTLTLQGPTAPMANVADVKDMADSSGDLRGLSAHVRGDYLFLSMNVQGVACPATEQTPDGMNNRYYYHFLLDTDNNPATGRSNSEYEGNPTGVTNPIGADRIIQVGWRDGKPNGIEAYDPANEDVILFSGFRYQGSGNSIHAVVPLSALDLVPGQTIAISAFQEGASDGWATDWMERDVFALDPLSSGRMKIDGDFADWTDAADAGLVVGVDDGQDMADSSGDLKRIEATVENGYLYLRMAVHGIIAPSVEETPAGMKNRYYYHWLLDTDNNPATGRSNSEYEGNPTGAPDPIGADLYVMLGWRDGAVNGTEVYEALSENVILDTFEFEATGDSVEVRIPLDAIGLSLGQTIRLSAFQEGASDGWATDWMGSTPLTLIQGGDNMSLENTFAGDPVGFRIEVTDADPDVVDPGTVATSVDGILVTPTVTKEGGVTTIVGQHPALLAPDTVHTVSLALEANGAVQSKDFVFKVDPYTVLPAETRFTSLDETQHGFVANVCQISSSQTLTGALHENKADLAEKQLAGEMKDPNTGVVYYNEVETEFNKWQITPEIVEGVVNWYQLAPGASASLNFPDDEPFPKMDMLGVWGLPVQGQVIEILGYVKLSQGFHKLGLYTEGGHKATCGFNPDDVLLSQFDNSDDVSRVPTYYARNQFFDVVAPADGYYPIRWLWFQTDRNQEDGMVLELFSVENRQLHLLNDADDPAALPVYRAGVLLDPNFVMPTLQIARDATSVTVTWTGTLQTADSVTGPWTDFGDDSRSPAVFATDAMPANFFRSRSD